MHVKERRSNGGAPSVVCEWRATEPALRVVLTSMALLLGASSARAGTGPPAACPPEPVRVVRSAGGVVDYHGVVAGIPDLCRFERADGEGDFYFGVWRSNWPGAGQAYPALRETILGPVGTRSEFITRSVPGWQWKDAFINKGPAPLVVDGQSYQTLVVAHERTGIEGNTYHSVITSWRDMATGMTLKVVEDQISGRSYGPNTTWTAVRVERLP